MTSSKDELPPMTSFTTESRPHNFRRTARKLGPSLEHLEMCLRVAREVAACTAFVADQLRAQLQAARVRADQEGEIHRALMAAHSTCSNPTLGVGILEVLSATEETLERAEEGAEHAALQVGFAERNAALYASDVDVAAAKLCARRVTTTPNARVVRACVRVRRPARGRARRSRVVRAVAGKTTSTGDPEASPGDPSPLRPVAEAARFYTSIGGAL